MELDKLVEAAYAAGTIAWPGVALSRAAFADRLARTGVQPEHLAAHADGLFLATACEQGIPAALDAFERTFLVKVPAWTSQLRLTSDQQDELTQRLRIKLLVGPPPKVADYRGTGPLNAWVRMCAVRMALDFKEAADPSTRGDVEALDALIAGGASPELASAKSQHGQLFRAALDEALQALTPRDKTILRMHVVDGLNIDEIGLAFRVHRATAARWLVAIREHVLAAVRRRVKLTLRSSSSEFRSLYQVVRSDIQVTVGRVLGE